MKETIYTCNICKHEIKGYTVVVPVIYELNKVTNELSSEGELDQVHWCHSCAKDVAKFITGIFKVELPEETEAVEDVAEPAVEVAPAQPQKESGRTSGVNAGTVIALRQAGWTYKDIGAELGCNFQRARNAMQRMLQRIQRLREDNTSLEAICEITGLDDKAVVYCISQLED